MEGKMHRKWISMIVLFTFLHLLVSGCVKKTTVPKASQFVTDGLKTLKFFLMTWVNGPKAQALIGAMAQKAIAKKIADGQPPQHKTITGAVAYGCFIKAGHTILNSCVKS